MGEERRARARGREARRVVTLSEGIPLHTSLGNKEERRVCPYVRNACSILSTGECLGCIQGIIQHACFPLNQCMLPLVSRRVLVHVCTP